MLLRIWRKRTEEKITIIREFEEGIKRRVEFRYGDQDSENTWVLYS